MFMNRVLSNSVTAFTGGDFTRRQFMRDLIAVPVFISLALCARASNVPSEDVKNTHIGYGETTLPTGIRSRFVKNVNGLTIHILEAGFETKGRPCVLLLHGFPELAYSWRKVMLPLAQAGYHVVAPDQVSKLLIDFLQRARAKNRK